MRIPPAGMRLPRRALCPPPAGTCRRRRRRRRRRLAGAPPRAALAPGPARRGLVAARGAALCTWTGTPRLFCHVPPDAQDMPACGCSSASRSARWRRHAGCLTALRSKTPRRYSSSRSSYSLFQKYCSPLVWNQMHAHHPSESRLLIEDAIEDAPNASWSSMRHRNVT